MRKKQERKAGARMLSLTISAALMLSGVPIAGNSMVMAAEGTTEVAADQTGISQQNDEADAVTDSGTFGGEKDSSGAVITPDTHEWAFASGSGLLTISGEGPMPNYTSGTYSSVPWYGHKDDIKRIVFKGKVTRIGSYAFYGYNKVEEVDFGGAEELTEIGEAAFQNAKGLVALTGTESLTTLEKNCFNSSGLKTVSMPNVEAIPETAFRMCTSMTSIEFQNATVVGKNAFYYNTELTEVKMPNVSELNSNAFQKCYALENIAMPELLTITGGWQFNECTALKRVSFPKLTSIDGNSVFNGCASLEVLDLPEVVQMTNASSLATNCSSLLWVNLPKAQITSKKASSLFTLCPSLVWIDVSAAVSLGGLFKNCANLQRVYIKGAGLNGDVTGTFWNAMPEGVKIYVGDETAAGHFSGYTKGTVETAADMDALKKKETTLLVSQEDYDVTSPVEPKVTGNAQGAELSYRYYTDIQCTQAVNADDPTQKPTVPGEYYVRATAGAVGDSYFATTSNPAKFTLFGEIQKEGFTYHNKTHVLTITDASVMDTDYTDASETPWKDYYREVEKIAVKEGVTLTKIADYAFYGMNKMTSFTLPETVTSIGARAFYGCSIWESENVLTDRVTSLGNYAFYGCKKISGTMTINNAITEIPECLLERCENVTRIVYSDQVTSFGQRCFYGTGVTELALPQGITEIPEYFYAGCKNITSVAIPETVTSLGDWCFSECEGLKEINVPDTVTSIGNDCFREAGITSFTLPPNLISLGLRVFYNTDNLESFEIPASLTTLPEELFYGSGLKKLIVPTTVTQINKGVFRDCEQMEYLEFANDEYTSDTFLGAPFGAAEKNYDSTFAGLPETAMVICDGSTYDVLASRGTYKQDKLNGWLAEEILYKRSEHLAKLDSDYAAVKEEASALTESDYDPELWTAFEEALAQAEVLVNTGDTTYDKIMNKTAAKDSIPTAVKSFLRATYQKTLDVLEADYDTEGDGADAWFAYLDQRDAALMLLQNEKATVSEIAESEKELRQALGQIVLLPTDEAKAGFDSTVKEAEALKEAEYTSESWSALQAAIKEAQEICKDATKISQVEAAKKKVEEAMAALVKVEVKDPVVDPTKDPGTSSTQAPGTNPTKDPDTQSSASPSPEPSTKPTTEPTKNPGVQPTQNPGGNQPTQKPSGTKPKKKVTVKKVTLKKVKSTKKKTITVQWKKVAGVTGYQVQIGTNKKVTKGKKTYTVKKAKTVKKTIKKLKRKKKYYVRVRAYKTVSGKKYYGKWSKVKKVKVK